MRQELTKEDFEKLNTSRIEHLDKGDEWISFISAISSLVPSDIIPLFGKADFSYLSEYNTKIWSFKIESDYYFILSAYGRGTTIESTSSDVSKIKIFINEFLKDLKDLPKVSLYLNMYNKGTKRSLKYIKKF